MASNLLSPVAEEQAIAPRRKYLSEITDELLQLFYMKEQLQADAAQDDPDTGFEERQRQIEAIDQEIERLICIDLADKADAIEWVDRRRQLEVADLQDEINALECKIGRINQQRAQVREMVRQAMERLQITQLKGRVATISLVEPKTLKLEVFSENDVPTDYFKPIVTLVLDKAAVRSDLEQDKLVPGARLKEADSYLQIRGAVKRKK